MSYCKTIKYATDKHFDRLIRFYSFIYNIYINIRIPTYTSTYIYIYITYIIHKEY